MWNYVLQGLRNGVIKLLTKKMFEKTQIEITFGYMSVGKHIKKVSSLLLA